MAKVGQQAPAECVRWNAVHDALEITGEDPNKGCSAARNALHQLKRWMAVTLDPPHPGVEWIVTQRGHGPGLNPDVVWIADNSVRRLFRSTHTPAIDPDFLANSQTEQKQRVRRPSGAQSGD